MQLWCWGRAETQLVAVALTRGVPHPTAAVRLRFPVARMMEDASAATTVAPSRLHETRRAGDKEGDSYLLRQLRAQLPELA